MVQIFELKPGQDMPGRWILLTNDLKMMSAFVNHSSGRTYRFANEGELPGLIETAKQHAVEIDAPIIYIERKP